MNEKDYNSAEGIRRSDLWKMADSPEKFRYFQENPSEQTDALVFGSACHKMILEPESFGDEYAVMPNVDGRTKEGKEIKARFAAESEGKTVITEGQSLQMAEMEAALERCPMALKMIRDGQHEVPVFWTDPETGEKCKAKMDVVLKNPDGKYIVIDYKTAGSARTDKFNKSVFNFGYSMQAAMYTEGLQIALKLDYRPQFAFIVQEKKAPYSVNVIGVSPEVMEHGHRMYHNLLNQYHVCMEMDEWPGYLPVDGGMNWTELPGWVDDDEEEEE